MRLVWIGLIVILICLTGGLNSTRAASHDLEPSAPDAQPACQWGYFPGGMGSWVPLFSDPENTTPSALRLGSTLASHSTSLAKRGGIDFNGDGHGDIFRIGLDGSQNAAWQMVSSTAAPGPVSWTTLRTGDNGADPSSIWFGDFNNDGHTDIFYRVYTDPIYGYYTWYYNSAGSSAPTVLGTYEDTITPVAVGDFNNDGKSDVFSFIANSPYAGAYHWQLYSGGTGTASNLAYALINPYDLRFGDFNGDGVTDVFAALPAANGQYQWVYSSAGYYSFQNLALTNYPVSQLSFGDFNTDGITDVFARVETPGSIPRWQYWSGGMGAAILLRYTDDPMPYLADMNGDKITDAVLARCASGLTFSEQFAGQNTLLDSAASYQAYAADLNGDKASDLLWASLYQSTASPNQIWAAGLLSNPASHSYTPLANQVLDTASWGGARPFLGDFDKDGKVDLVINKLTDTVNNTRVLHWTQAGFTLSPLIAFSGLPGLVNTGSGDFNGDGRIDLIWGANCINVGNNCIAGYPAQNPVTVAMSSGSNMLMSTPQTFPNFPGSEYFGQVLDVNGDGKDDLVYTNGWYIGNNTVYVALSNGDGSFNLLPAQTFGAAWHYNVFGFIGDFNGDGRQDLALSSQCSTLDCAGKFAIRILFGTSSGLLQASGTISFGVRDWYSYGLRVADINADGRDDLVWTTGGKTDFVYTSFVMVSYSNGDGSFTNSGLLQLKEAFAYSPSPLIGDFNADGRPDLMWVSGGAYKPLLNLPHRIFFPILKR